MHTACAVRDWLAEHADAIELFYLPSYSPALNPDEYLTGDLEMSVAKRAPAWDRDSLLRTATSRPRSRQQRPDQVKTFFQHPACGTPRDVRYLLAQVVVPAVTMRRSGRQSW